MRRELQRRLGVRDAPQDRADALVRGSISGYDADVPVAFSAKVPVGVTHGEAQVTANVVPAAIRLSNVMATVLLVATEMASGPGNTPVTSGGVGATQSVAGPHSVVVKACQTDGKPSDSSSPPGI